MYKRQDLSHFKVEGEIADTYGDLVAAGGKAVVKIGNDKLEGTVSSVTPVSYTHLLYSAIITHEEYICFASYPGSKGVRSGQNQLFFSEMCIRDSCPYGLLNQAAVTLHDLLFQRVNRSETDSCND